MHFILAMAVALTIPVSGYVLSDLIIHNLNSELSKDGLSNITEMCGLLGHPDVSANLIKSISGLCGEVQSIFLLGKISLWAGVLGVFIPLLFGFGALIAGENRRRMSLIFPALVRISTLLLAVMVFVQGGIITYSSYVGLAYWTERFSPKLTLVLGVGTVIGGVTLIIHALRLGKPLSMKEFGIALSDNNAPKLFEFVRTIADKLGAQPPQNIVVGLKPSFYVTNCDVEVLGNESKRCRGETLYLSAIVARILTTEELATVIGHELGHFRGADTIYSLKFAPVYAGLRQSLNAMAMSDNEKGSGASLVGLPAASILSFMLSLFSKGESKISREREFLADKAGCEVGSPLDLSTALIKLALYSGFWPKAREQNIERLNKRKIADNLSEVFHDMVCFDVATEKLGEAVDSVLEKKISHPTDSHPTIRARLEALGVSVDDITKDRLAPAKVPSVTLIDNHEEIERQVTVFEHKLMISLGAAKPEEGAPTDAESFSFLDASYCLAAAVVGADGQILADEVTTAEVIGKQLFLEFDPVSFRAICKKHKDLPDVVGLAEAIGPTLEDKGRQLLLKYLRAIAEADGTISKDEQDLLNKIEEAFGKNH